jgi:erythromycin esterase
MNDLEALADLVGGARVVGIGETAHHVGEYVTFRHRAVRFLVERLGFTTVALESGFSEGLSVRRWIDGGAGSLPEVAESGLTYRLGRAPEMQRFLAWMRAAKVDFTGLDLPGDLASMLPALDSLDRYLDGVDTYAVELVGRIRRHAAKYAGPHTLPAFAAYRAMDQADRDELTLLLAELSARFDAQKPNFVRADYPATRHELRLAVLLDQQLRAQLAGQLGTVNIRDAAMAETARQLTGKTIVLAANTHLQRIPFGPLPVLGTFLAGELGDDYLAIAVTCRGGRTPTRRRAANPAGFELVDVDLTDPAPGSVEAMLSSTFLDLRPLRAAGGPQRIRSLDTYTEMPVAQAFDLVAGLPTISPLPPGQR